MAKDKYAKLNLEGYYAAKGEILKRLPRVPSRNEIAFHSETGGVDEFRQVGWVSMNTKQVWGLDEKEPKDVPDMTPIYINVRGD